VNASSAPSRAHAFAIEIGILLLRRKQTRILASDEFA